MANFSQAIKLLPLTRNSQTMYKGIDRTYYPKWQGWAELDSGCTDAQVLDNLVYPFYNSYYWDRLNLGQVQDQDLANLLFIFSVQHGKRKAIEKVERILSILGVLETRPTGNFDKDLISKVNDLSDQGLSIFLSVYAEMVEFLVVTHSTQEIGKLLKVYYQYLNCLPKGF